MEQKQPSIYKRARLIRGYTQEDAAELLGVSIDSLKSYETGRTIPNNSIVANMEKIYVADYLLKLHIKLDPASASVVPDFKIGENIGVAILNLFNEHGKIAKYKERLVEIGADGKIDESEREIMESILKECEGLTSAILTMMYADDGNSTDN